MFGFIAHMLLLTTHVLLLTWYYSHVTTHSSLLIARVLASLAQVPTKATTMEKTTMGKRFFCTMEVIQAKEAATRDKEAEAKAIKATINIANVDE